MPPMSSPNLKPRADRIEPAPGSGESLSAAERARVFNTLKNQLQRPKASISSGYPALDACLPGRGWPLGSLVEVLLPDAGHGEQQLLLPVLKQLQQRNRQLVWLQPPQLPYPPGLEARGLASRQQWLVQPGNNREALWSMEQLLQSPQCGAVIAWLQPMGQHSLRRLQLAAETGGNLAVLVRHERALDDPSPAAVRLRLEVRERRLQVQLVKIRGGRPGTVALPWSNEAH